MHASPQVASLAYRFSQSGLCIASRRTCLCWLALS
jgi:hypothetical protein